MLVIAHRGASGHAPEHTFASWDLALEMGADYLEQDLQMTADGTLIVLHDDTLDRTTRGRCSGPVRDRTLDQITDCDVGSWFIEAFPDRARPGFADQRIATLDQVFDRYRGRARFYIETKNPRAAPGMEAELLRVLSRHALLPGQTETGTVIIQSFSGSSLRHIHRAQPRIPLVQLLGSHEFRFTIRLRLGRIAGWAQGIGPAAGDVDAALVHSAHAKGLVVHPYTVNDSNEMQRLIAAGVDGMFTDFPDRLAALRDHAPGDSAPAM